MQLAGAKILKRLSTEEVYAQEIRRLRGLDLLTTLLLECVCESNDDASSPTPGMLGQPVPSMRQALFAGTGGPGRE